MNENDLLYLSDALAGELTEAEQQDLSRRLASDPEFAKAYHDRLAEVRVLKAKQRAEAKAALRAELMPAKTGRTVAFRPVWAWGGLAAAAALTLLLWVAGPFRTALPPADTLAMSYLEPYPMSSVRGAEGASHVPDSVVILYQEGRYRELIPALAALHALYPEEDLITLYLADCLSLSGKYTDAARVLNGVDKGSLMQDAVQWRLALNAVLAGEGEKARDLLAPLREGTHYRQAQADSLWRALGKFKAPQ